MVTLEPSSNLYSTFELLSYHTEKMASAQESGTGHRESPASPSRAVNIYDIADTEDDWIDRDDDMDYEPTTDDSEDNEFFDPSEEDVEAEFHGMLLGH